VLRAKGVDRPLTVEVLSDGLGELDPEALGRRLGEGTRALLRSLAA
jgi:hypothetical protein